MKWSWLSSFFPPITTLSKVCRERSLEMQDGDYNKENYLPDHISALRQNPRGYPAPPLRWLQTLWWCSAIHVIGDEVNLFTKKSSMDIAIVGNHLEEYAMDISRISPDMLWVPIISKSLRHDYQDNSLRINSYCNSCYSTTNVRWNKLWKCCCLYEHSWLAITAVYIITFHVRAFLVMMKYVDTSIRIKNGCMVGLGSSMMMFLVLNKRGVWSG